MVISCRYLRRVVPELVAPGIAHIHVNRVAEAVQFPHAGHGHVAPAFVVEIGFPEVGRMLVGIVHPEEFPGTVQGHEVGRLLFDAVVRCLCRFVGKVVGVHRGTVYGVNFRVLPFVERLGVSGYCQSCI